MSMECVTGTCYLPRKERDLVRLQPGDAAADRAPARRALLHRASREAL